MLIVGCTMYIFKVVAYILYISHAHVHITQGIYGVYFRLFWRENLFNSMHRSIHVVSILDMEHL